MHDGKHQRHMAASCTYHLPPSASCSTKGKEKVFLRTMFLEKEKKMENGTSTAKWQEGNGNRTMQKNKKAGDQKGRIQWKQWRIFQTEGKHLTPPASLQRSHSPRNSALEMYCAQQSLRHRQAEHTTACRLTQCLSNSSEKLQLICSTFCFHRISGYWFFNYFCSSSFLRE